MFAVEVQDAQGRVVPITDNWSPSKSPAKGKLIGVGNGDPTDQEPDKGTSRKAFSGFCMAHCAVNKDGRQHHRRGHFARTHLRRGHHPSKAVTLRPQVAVWKREVPSGQGVTGLWRPVRASSGPSDDFISMLAGTNAVFTLRQDGGKLTGMVEGIAGFFGGDDVPIPVVAGTVNGDRIAFKSGDSSFTGSINGDRIELQRSLNLPWETPSLRRRSRDDPRSGPAPDGSDPSTDPTGEVPSSIPVVLRRVER